MNEKTPEVMIIEDVEEMSTLEKLYLSKSAIGSRTYTTAEAALDDLEGGFVPDLVLLDLNLPGMSGFEFLKHFREKYEKTIPVMILSARDADEDIIEGLGFGADDFVTKPFSPRVLVARVEASLRRSVVSVQTEANAKFGDFTVLLNSCVLKQGSAKIPLSTKEYEVLECLLKHAGETLSPEAIYSEVWKNKYGDITAVAVYIQRLRKKIEADPSVPKYLLTVYGQGYCFPKDLVTFS